MLNGSVYMTDMEEQSALSSLKRNYMNTFSIVTGEKMFRVLLEKHLSKLITNGRRKEIIVVAVLLLFSSITTSAMQLTLETQELSL